MDYFKYAAKAIVAVITVVLAGVVAGELSFDPWIVITLQAVLAGVGVFAVRNAETPYGDDPVD